MADYVVLAAWNGSGSALVFESAEAKDEMLELYEEFRKQHVLPWITSKDAVRGEDVLEMWRLGYRPWKVFVSIDGHAKYANPIPLHHIASRQVVESHANGAVRGVQVWAENAEAAVQYAAKMIADSNAPAEGLAADVDFGCSNYPLIDISEVQMPYTGPRRAYGSSDVLKTATKKQANAPPKMIPGFGQVVDLGNL